MSRNKSLAKNTSYIAIGSIGGSLVGFLMLPLYTRWLSPADYGIVDLLQTYSSLLMFVITFNISDAIFVFPVNETRENVSRYFTTGLLFILACSVLCALVFYIISLLEFDNEFIHNIWQIFGLLLSSIFLRYSQDFCRGINKMSIFGYTGIIQSFSIAILSFLFIPQYGANGYVFSIIVSSILSALFSLFYSHSYCYFNIRLYTNRFLIKMLKYCMPLLPTSILWWLISSLNRPLLEKYVGVYAIGLFALANKLPYMLNTVFGFFQKAWQVTVIEEYKSNDFVLYYNRMFRMIYSIQILFTLLITLFSNLFIKLMTTEEYYSARVYIPILCLSVLFTNTSAFCGTIFSATRQSKYMLYSVIIGGVIAILGNFILIPTIGLWGACFVTLLSSASNMISRIFFSSKLVRFNSYKYMIIQLFSVFMIYVGVISNNISILTISILLGLSLYFFTNKKEIYYVINFIYSKVYIKK